YESRAAVSLEYSAAPSGRGHPGYVRHPACPTSPLADCLQPFPITPVPKCSLLFTLKYSDRELKLKTSACRRSGGDIPKRAEPGTGILKRKSRLSAAPPYRPRRRSHQLFLRSIC